MYHVYVRTDDAGRIVEINSDVFLQDTSGMQLIDSGYTDRYQHAQRNYLPKPIRAENGVWRYKLENGQIVERTADEMAQDAPGSTQDATLEQRVEALETKVNEEMADQQAALAELGVTVDG